MRRKISKSSIGRARIHGSGVGGLGNNDVGAGDSTTSLNSISRRIQRPTPSIMKSLANMSLNKDSDAGRSSPAQIVLLKRKRNQEPLDGLLLENAGGASRHPSDSDLNKDGTSGLEDDLDERGGRSGLTQSNSMRARKRKRLAPARGFFQLAETVEKATWDNEAWRRDFNERVLAKTKEGRKALAAAAGVEAPLDSPVIEKSQPVSASPNTSGLLSPTATTNGVKPPRKYTVVLQSRPQLPVESTPGIVQPAYDESEDKYPKKRVKTDSTTQVGGTLAREATARADAIIPQPPIQAKDRVVYFDAVPVKSVSDEESENERRAREEEEELAAFMPMLQDYLKQSNISSTPRIEEPRRSEMRGPKERTTEKGKSKEEGDSETDEEDYVYDVYFKGNHEPTASDWNNLGNYGTLVSLPREFLQDEDSDDFEDYSEGSDDEDSNAEEFYRNDYPDEEDDYSDEDEDSDEFYNDRDDSEEEEDYDDDTRWR